MIDATARAPWFKRWWYKAVARAYYAAVRRFGRQHFTYRRWDYEPTLEQLEREVRARRGGSFLLEGLAEAVGLKRPDDE